MSNELKATKGPWAAIDHGVGELVVYSKDTEDAICVLDDTDEHYAWKEGYSTSEEARANAHLIAAAKELYEEDDQRARTLGQVYTMLLQGETQEAIDLIYESEVIDYSTGEPVAVSTALAKARGEES